MFALTRQKSTLFQWLAVPLWVPIGKNSVPTDSGAFRSQFCGRAIVNAVLIAIENRVRLSEHIGQFMELTHQAPSSRRAAGSRSTRTQCPESVGTLFLPMGTH